MAGESLSAAVRLGPPLAMVIGACGSQPDGPVAVERTDSAGVEIVRTDMPVWTEETAWLVAPEPELVIGRRERARQHLLSRVVGAVRLPDGRIVVGDGGSNELRFFDRDGAFLRAVGREGEGPGEFQYLRELRRCEADFLHAFDIHWQRTRFDLEGEFVDRVDLVTTEGISPYRLSCDAEGRFLVTGWGIGDRGRVGFYRTTVPLLLLDTSGLVLNDLGTVPGSERIGTPRGSSPHRFGKTTVHRLAGDRIYLGTGDEPEIRVAALEGRPQRLIRWAAGDLALTRQHVEAYREAELAAADPSVRPVLERRIREMEFPPTVPAYVELELDAADHLWAQAFLPPGEGRQRWFVFAPDGAWLGEVVLPERLRALEIGDDYLLGLHRDELDVERVRLHRIIKPEAGSDA